MNRGELWTVAGGVHAPEPRPALIVQDSWIMVDKLTTVRRSNVRERVGRGPAALLVDVERSLMVLLGPAG